MKLVFVYNVNSGLLDRFIDNAHKIVSPATYDCNLCAITFGKFTEDELWRAFREHTPVEMEFHHKDEFQEKYASKASSFSQFPSVFSEDKDELNTFISREALNEMESSEELIEAIKKRLSPY